MLPPTRSARSALGRQLVAGFTLGNGGSQVREERVEQWHRDRQAGVPELVADDVDRHALAHQLGGVGVPQAVRVNPLLDPGPGLDPWCSRRRAAVPAPR